MMLKLLKPYNLLFLLIALLLLGSTSLYAQNPGDPSNFSIRGDIYSGTPIPTSPLSDDWFQGTTGNGMIDESSKASFLDITVNRRNLPFTARSPYNQYKELNGFLLYDAIYGRDYVDFNSAGLGKDKTAFTGSSGKNGDNPQTDWSTSVNESVPSKNDLVDVYAHLRRAGLTLGTNMWLTMGVSTLSNTGSHFVDFELYAEPFEQQGNGFANSGLNITEGHTPWVFNGAGKITSSGDLIVGFAFNGPNVSGVELRIWTKRSTWLSSSPQGFSWGPAFDGSGNSSLYGYAQIIIPSGGSFDSGSSGTIKGPPWKTLKETGGNVTANYEEGYFVEVGVNLSSLGIDPSLSSGNPCDAPFKKIFIKSRTSEAFNSALKDFAGPYNFLGASVVDTKIKKEDPGYFQCGALTLGLSPLNPKTGSYYLWSTTDGEFSNGQQTFTGQDATAVKPGLYRLSAAPIEGCTESFHEIRVYAQPCTQPDFGEVIENNGLNGSVTLNVSLNDSDLDADLDPTTVKIGGLYNATQLINAQHGTITIDGSGLLTYLPNPGYYGIDTVEYVISDQTPPGLPHNGPLKNKALITFNVLRDSDADNVPNRDDLDDDNDGIPDTIEQGQTSSTPDNCTGSPNMNFNSAYTEVSGDGNNSTFLKGEIFKFTEILPGTDAFVTIVDMMNATVGSLDMVGAYPNSFQPETNYIALTNGQRAYVEYKFEFKKTDGTPVIIPEFYVNFNDVDGDSSFRELNWTELPESYTLNDPTEITITKEGTWLIGISGTRSVGGTSDAYPEINYSTKQINRSNYSIRVGLEARASIVGSYIQHNIEFSCTNNYTSPVIADLQYDFDGDSIPNYLDLDSDNDGIPDVVEAGLTDANNDGLVDVDASGYGVNGLADIVETASDSGVINYTPLNSDAASDISTNMYDFIDVDSDNDGISDTTEAFSKNPSYNDVDNNGQIDGFVDANKNGWHDLIDAEIALPTLLNSDADTLPNYRDLDSDGDGLPDTFEGNFEVLDEDNDGIVGLGIPIDEDKNGLADINDPGFSGNVLGGYGFYQDRDGDGVPNHLDIDIDNDGIIDNIEGQGTFSYIAPTGVDTDGDGIDNAYDVNNGGVGIGYVNTDGGNAPDYADTDSEDDNVFDLSENFFNNDPSTPPSDTALDADSDGMVDPGTPDSDGDGLVDIFDVVAGTSNAANATNGGQTAYSQPDTDPVGGDRDWREKFTQDHDHDGVPDVTDLDDDNDGILDIDELAGADDDMDGDGLINSFDLDSDGDGIPDHIEAGDNFDADGNGMPGTGLLVRADVDAQGVPLLVTWDGGYSGYGLVPLDSDEDGFYNYLDLDSDNDGIVDAIEAGGIDPDGNGIYGAGNRNDKDADGLADALDTMYNTNIYDNNDVLLTPMGTVMGGTPLTILDTSDSLHKPLDTDGDSVADYLDLDSDNDTITDNVEAQSTLGYIAYIATDTDNDGITDNYDFNNGTPIIPIDFDFDGIPDYLDLDSDNDGLYDITEAHTPAITNNSGRTKGILSSNGLDVRYSNGSAGNEYADPNGKVDDTQADNWPDEDADVYTGGDVDYRDSTFNDFDEDGIADSIDLDDDNDGIPDTIESNGGDPLADADTDGIPNYKDPDFCAGGALNSFGICPEFDIDEDGIPNHFDLDSDGDGCSDAIEATATTDPTTEYQFPAGSVGAYGIPTAVEKPTDDTKINYTVEQTFGTTYDFLDADVFVACKADLSLNKTVDKPSAEIGETVIFTITLTNSGPFSVSEVKVRDLMPEGLINISYTSSFGSYDIFTGIWDLTGHLIEPVSPGNLETLEITATIGPNCEPIINNAEVFSSERSDPDSIPNNGL